MIRLELQRLVRDKGYTIGNLKTPLRTFWTLEDTVREEPGKPVEQWKIKGVTAIPVGTYKLIVSFSRRFQKMLPLLVDVPGYSGVRIHAGNGPADTEGCILIGQGLNSEGDRILNSRAAMIDFMDELDGYLDAGMEMEIDVR